jgi:hypothetical protein
LAAVARHGIAVIEVPKGPGALRCGIDAEADVLAHVGVNPQLLLVVDRGDGGAERRDLRRRGAATPLLFQHLFDLLPPRTGRLEILGRVAANLQLAALATLDLISHPDPRDAGLTQGGDDPLATVDFPSERGALPPRAHLAQQRDPCERPHVAGALT